MNSPETARVRVEALWIYPIKSCAGISLERAVCTPRGLAHDRRWVLIDEDGRFLSQRKHPNMARILPTLHGEGLRVCAPDQAPLTITPARGALIETTVWDDTFPARHVSDEADAWFSAAVGVPCRLVEVVDARGRHMTRAGFESQALTAVDTAPILCVTRASLDALHTTLGREVDALRFRPNVVLSGAEAFDEYDWDTLTNAALGLRRVKPCSRCLVVNVNPNTGKRDEGDTLAALATLPRPGEKLYFGLYVAPDLANAEERGGQVRALSRGDTLTITRLSR